MLTPLLLAALLISASPVELVPATAAQVLDGVRSAGAKLTVVNVWATWCLPCREEFPHLVRLQKDLRRRGVAVLFVSGDFASAESQAVDFLVEQGVEGRAYRKAQPDQAFIDGLDPKWSGALPATFVFDAAGRRLVSLYEPVTYESLKEQIEDLLSQSRRGGST
jgi:thiol-disulfide isomerase/thioredoxin